MEMAGYRRVNYYELCRLCTSSEGTKMHIFREEGRRRSLPNKIQTCLPLTVQEEDSLPKIICSSCVEKLENYFEFRESCINAEAMLESYFTSLRYSDDLPREGKVSVYVKEEAIKKKEESNAPKIKTTTIASSATTTANTSAPAPIVSHVSAINNESVPIPSAIQILTDQDGNRLAQYKVQVQGGVPSLIPSYPSVQMSMPNLQQVKAVQHEASSSHVSQAETTASVPSSLVAAVTLTPQSHDLFGFNTKDRYRSPLGQISEALKMKNINIIDASMMEQSPGLSAPAGMQFRIDPEQLQQLMNSGSGLQLNLNTMAAAKTERREKEEAKTELELKFDEDDQPLDISEVTVELNDQEGQTFECDMCIKVFKRKEHLLQHKKSHTGQRPFVCTSCGKAFSRKEHLLRHKVSHTGQKLYTCDVCQKNFSRKDNLHKHKKTHGINGPHVCEVCGKSFVLKHYYAIHRATHAKEPKSVICSQQQQSYQSPKVAKSQGDGHRQKHRAKVKHEEEVNESVEDQQHNQALLNQQQQMQLQSQVAVSQQQQQQQQPTIIASFPMTTINPQTLLGSNIIHSAGGMVHIGNTSYVCSTELLDQYRRIHSTQ